MYTSFERDLNLRYSMISQIPYTHTPVLANQVIEILNPKPGKIFIDATLGLGGHSEALLKEMHGEGSLYGLEADERNLELAKERLGAYKNVHYIHDNFENLEKYEERIDGILFDLGLSSPHVEDANRGFSFQHEGPLDMRFDTRQTITAADIINTYPLENLIFIFQNYGEEKHSKKLANEIIQYRKHGKFTTTTQLKDFIARAAGFVHPEKCYFKRHPATRVFQALRIATNREIEVLEKGLGKALNILSPQGKLIVISYHSLEDRIVKNLFRNQKKAGSIKILTKKPVTPTQEEIKENRRSRSAKLRAAEKL